MNNSSPSPATRGLVERLNAVAGVNDWSCRQLEAAIRAATGSSRTPECWRRTLNGETTLSKRTAYLIERFLVAVAGNKVAA